MKTKFKQAYMQCVKTFGELNRHAKRDQVNNL